MHRNSRFQSRLPAALTSPHLAVVVGVGAIGHQVARLLGTMDIPLCLFDPDTVSEVNIGPQLYPPAHLETSKVEACRLEVARLNPELNIETWVGTFHAKRVPSNATALFCCADSMTARRYTSDVAKELFEARSDFSFYCEARMSPEFFEVRPSAGAGDIDHFQKSLFTDAEAEELPCSDKATPFCAYMAASTMVALFTQRLRNFELPRLVRADLMSNTLTPEYRS